MKVQWQVSIVTSYVWGKCKPAGYFCIEANPYLIGALRHGLDLNGANEVIVMHGAVTGDKGLAGRGWMEFGLWYEFWGSTAQKLSGSEVIRVPALHLDRLLTVLKPTVLICDAEGSEGEFLASSDLDGVRAVVMEIHPKMAIENRRPNILRLLLERGFVVASRESHVIVALKSSS